ncbi:MAG: ABC transporter permease [Promethearchaeota archaeon]
MLIQQEFSDTPSVLPYPTEVVKDFVHLMFNAVDGRTLLNHVLASLFRVFYGFIYAFIIGIALGVLMATNNVIDRLVQPILAMFRPIPPIAWIPFAIIFFGLGLPSQGFVIFVGALFPILQNTYDGIKLSEPVYRDVALSLGASKSQIVWEVILPSIAPNLLTGVRISIGVGWMSVIAAEMMGVSGNIGGIGYFINYMKDIGKYSYMIAGMLMIALVGLLIEIGFKLVEKKVLKWV